ncbi:hypothetical protein P8452_17436 [Trifolium repens]|nr:hypothetical protein P8452_17436 [Trifolium repens]
MANASNTRNDADHGNDDRDFVPTVSSPPEHNTVLSPVRQNDQPQRESDPETVVKPRCHRRKMTCKSCPFANQGSARKPRRKSRWPAHNPLTNQLGRIF